MRPRRWRRSRCRIRRSSSSCCSRRSWSKARCCCRTWRARLCAVSPASVEKATGCLTAPNNHFTAGPDCGLTIALNGSVGGAGGSPSVGSGIISPTGAGNWRYGWCWRRCCCRRRFAGRRSWRIGGFCGVSPADAVVTVGTSSPHYHFTVRPHCRVKVSGGGCAGGAGGCPAIRARLISPTAVYVAVAIIATPNHHLFAGPNCRVTPSTSGRVGNARGCPAIRRGVVSGTGIQPVLGPVERIPAPNDHFAASPDC